VFSNRYSKVEEVKISKLFDLVREKKHITDLDGVIAELFDKDTLDHNEKHNAYYRLKNRLKTELEKSLINLHNDVDDRVVTMNLITLSTLFGYRSEYELALYYLRKAEKLAVKNEFYDLLDLVYNHIIAFGHTLDEIDPEVYVKKIEDNKIQLELINQANHTIAIISYKLRRSKYNPEEEDVFESLTETLNELNLSGSAKKSPSIRFIIYQCIRDIYLQKKDFQQLQEYLTITFHEFEKDELFNKNNHTQKIKMLSWLVNVLNINKQWDKALTYTENLHSELLKYNKLHYDSFIWTYNQSLVTNFMSTNKLSEAVQKLEEIKDLATHRGQMFYDYAIFLNLTLCYYFMGKIGMSIRTLSSLLSKDMYPKLTPDLQYSISLLEVILHFENANKDFAEYKLNEFKRVFRKTIAKPEMLEDKNFIKILSGLIDRPFPFRDKLLVKQMNQFVEASHDLEVGSNRHVDYKLWIQSRLQKLSYYQLLLAQLNPDLKLV